MALKTLVKVGNINNLSDARYCAGMMVDMLGFNINEEDSENISLKKYQEITGWIAGVKHVVEYDGDSFEYLNKSLTDYACDYFQLSNLNLAEQINTNKELIFKIDLGKVSDSSEVKDILAKLHAKTAYFVVEDSTGDKKIEELKSLLALTENYPILFGTGINVDNVNQIIDNNPISGITLTGGHEIKPGFKDYDELADILEAIEIED